jgi:hypothetical protein
VTGGVGVTHNPLAGRSGHRHLGGRNGSAGWIEHHAGEHPRDHRGLGKKMWSENEADQENGGDANHKTSVDIETQSQNTKKAYDSKSRPVKSYL